MDGSLNTVTDIGFFDKFSNLAPFMLWAFIIVVIVVAAIWAFDKWALTKQDLRKELDDNNMAWAVVIAGVFFSIFYFAGQAIGAPAKYDQDFRKATKIYFSTTVDWHWAKAQGMQESGLNPNVCSPVGACGLMQFMPGTAKQFRIDPFNSRDSIYAASKYMRWLWKNWSSPRPPLDRYYLALGSYNWGIGAMLKAQKRAERKNKPANLWSYIEPFVPRETAEYAPRIARWCQRFRKGRSCSIG